MVSGGSPGWEGPPLALGATFTVETVHVSVRWEGVYEGFPWEVKTFFVRGSMFPDEEVFSSAPVHGAVGSVGCSLPLGTALHSGIAVSLCFSAVPPPRSRFLVMGVFVMFLPPSSATPSPDGR